MFFLPLLHHILCAMNKNILPHLTYKSNDLPCFSTLSVACKHTRQLFYEKFLFLKNLLHLRFFYVKIGQIKYSPHGGVVCTWKTMCAKSTSCSRLDRVLACLKEQDSCIAKKAIHESFLYSIGEKRRKMYETLFEASR